MTANPILYGRLVFPKDWGRVTSRPRGLDTFVQNHQTDREDSFEAGGACPEYPNMRMKEVETTPEIPGFAYSHRVSYEGLKKPTDKIESNGIKTPAEGWDSGPMEFLTIHPAAYEIGKQHPTIPTLWCTDCDKDDLNGHVWRVSAEFRGFVPLAGGGIKSRKRRITANIGTKTFSAQASLGYVPGSDPPRTPFVAEDGTTFTGWEDIRWTNLDVSRVVVVDTFLSTDPPPTDKMPGHMTPADAPPVKDLLDDDWVFVDDIFWNWPWGWKIAGLQSEQLLDKAIWLHTITYEHATKYDPK